LIKSAIWAKASSIGHEQWEGGFLSTGQVFCDLDNVIMRPVDNDPTQARPRITVEAPLIFNGNASAATIALYNSQLVNFQIFIKSTQELKTFILNAIPLSFKLIYCLSIAVELSVQQEYMKYIYINIILISVTNPSIQLHQQQRLLLCC
jgi:hypothetical protein